MLPIATPPDEQDRINERILARLAHTDYLAQIEAPRRRIPVKIYSPEFKRTLFRFFDTLQVNVHFVSVFGRMRLPEQQVVGVETWLLNRIATLTAEVEHAIAETRALFDAHGILTPAEYEAPPIDIEVRVISNFGRRYLDLMVRADELMPLLETLSIDEVITQSEFQQRKQVVVRKVRAIAGAARTAAGTLRNQMIGLTAEVEAHPVAEAVNAVPHDSPVQSAAAPADSKVVALPVRTEEVATHASEASRVVEAPELAQRQTEAR